MFAHALIGATCAVAMTCAPAKATAGESSVAAGSPTAPADTSAHARAAAGPGAFTAIGDIGAFRLDGMRRGVQAGLPVRFLDFTLKNTGATPTFPRTLQRVWWQGRASGQTAQPLRRDGSHFGMHDQTIGPGLTIAVTYAIPDRGDVEGVTLSYPYATPAAPNRVLTWRHLAEAIGETTP
ncbi:hypothetical protein [Phenylobacterium sp.]|uniref:hypothetical protein n=1 Tax=Phenylobacterium sp. TaxID=1871053 RepID=UPI00301D2F7C